jgi:hypothetical protein
LQKNRAVASISQSGDARNPATPAFRQQGFELIVSAFSDYYVIFQLLRNSSWPRKFTENVR